MGGMPPIPPCFDLDCLKTGHEAPHVPGQRVDVRGRGVQRVEGGHEVGKLQKIPTQDVEGGRHDWTPRSAAPLFLGARVAEWLLSRPCRRQDRWGCRLRAGKRLRLRDGRRDRNGRRFGDELTRPKVGVKGDRDEGIEGDPEV